MEYLWSYRRRIAEMGNDIKKIFWILNSSRPVIFPPASLCLYTPFNQNADQPPCSVPFETHHFSVPTARSTILASNARRFTALPRPTQFVL